MNELGLREVEGMLVDNSACVGVIRLDRHEAVVETNKQAHVLLAREDGLMIRSGFLHSSSYQELQRLRSAIRSCLEHSKGQRTTYLLRLSKTASSGHLHVAIGSTAHAHRSFNQPVSVLVSDPDVRPTIEPSLLQQLHDFSTAEARVAALLATGISVVEISRRLGVQDNTVRVHLKAAYAKTNTTGQADLVRLILSGLGPFLRFPIALAPS